MAILEPDIGPFYSDGELRGILYSEELPFQRPHELGQEVAGFLNEGKSVVWFQGRPAVRTLMLSPDAFVQLDSFPVDLSNTGFFTTAFPENDLMAWFDERREVLAAVVPAAVHLDGTVRLFTVEKGTNRTMYDTLFSVNVRSEVPVLLNLPLNQFEPAVESPHQAIAMVRDGPADVLVLGPYLVSP